MAVETLRPPPRVVDCDTVQRRMDEFLDRELDPVLAERIQWHFNDCALCESAARATIRWSDHLRGCLRADAVPPGLAARIHDALWSD